MPEADDVVRELARVDEQVRGELAGGELELRRAAVRVAAGGGHEVMMAAARDLAEAAAKAGLVVTRLVPCGQSFWIQLWQPDGELWADGTGEGLEDVARHIRRWMNAGGRGRREHLVDQARRAGAVLRVAACVRHRLATSAEMRSDWRASAIDLLAGLEESAERGQHPDDIDRACRSIMDLAELWLEPGEAERVYLEGTALPDDGGS